MINNKFMSTGGWQDESRSHNQSDIVPKSESKALPPYVNNKSTHFCCRVHLPAACICRSGACYYPSRESFELHVNIMLKSCTGSIIQ